MRVSGAGHMTRRLSAFLAGLGVAVLLGPLAGPGRGRTDPDGPADTGAEPDGKSLDGRHDRCARGRRVQWCHANRCGGFGNWHRCLQLSGQRHLAGPGQRRKRFAYVKATEGTTYRNPYFAHQSNGFSMTGRFPVIYTSTSWWNQCVGSGHGFGATVPLWWLDLPPRSAPCPVVGPITRSAVQLDADRPEPLQRCL